MPSLSRAPLRRTRAALRHVRSDDAGLSMVEVIVALMVFAILATGVAYGLTNTLVLTQSSRARAAAVAIASEDLDAMRMRALNTKDGILQIASGSLSKVVGGTTYTVDRVVKWADTTGALGACGTGDNTLALKSVVDTVSWRLTGGAPPQSVRMATSVAPIGNLNTDTTGTVIVAVIGADGAPRPGVDVAIAPVSDGAVALAAAPQDTDGDGCSFGLKARPGTYRVTATQAGAIDLNQSDPATNSSVVVKAGQNTMVNFSYDQAAAFPLSYPAAPVAVATNLTVTLLHASIASRFANAPASARAFPWQDGYRVLAGAYVPAVAGGATTCVDTDPASWKTVDTDGAVGAATPAVAADPGETADPTAVPLATVAIGGLGSGDWVTAVTSATPGPGDPGCAAGQTLTFPRSSGGAQTIALPYGTWTLYSGTSKGATTRKLVGLSGVTVSLGTQRGTVNTANNAYTSTVTLDPRQVPAP